MCNCPVTSAVRRGGTGGFALALPRQFVAGRLQIIQGLGQLQVALLQFFLETLDFAPTILVALAEFAPPGT